MIPPNEDKDILLFANAGWLLYLRTDGTTNWWSPSLKKWSTDGGFKFSELGYAWTERYGCAVLETLEKSLREKLK
jgi:hypothetical protein